jgi:hypothetical protein
MKIVCPKCKEEFETIDDGVLHVPICPKKGRSLIVEEYPSKLISKVVK